MPRTATKEQVKSAYLSLVKTFHPDRLPPELNHLQAQARDVFSAIRDAYEVLMDDAKRAAYVNQSAAPKPAASGPTPGGVPAGQDPEVIAKQGDAALRKKEYVAAAQLFEKVYATTKKPVHLAQQAWAIYLDPAKKDRLPAVKGMLEKALNEDRKCDKAAYYLGVIARVEGDAERAEQLFKTAVDANPSFVEAQTELRLLRMRKGKPGGKKGLFR